MKTHKDELEDLYRVRDFYIHLYEKERKNNRFLWIFIGILGMVISLLSIDIARASTIQLIPSSVYAEKGQEFEVTALIIPERSNYTTVLKMCFKNAELMSFYQPLNNQISSLNETLEFIKKSL